MWWTKENVDVQELKDKIAELQSERKVLKEEVEDLKLKKKIEDEDIRHMVKMKEESLEQKFLRKEMEMEKRKDKEVATCKDAYRDKLEVFLTKRGDDIKEMYNEILARLPDVNVKLKGDL